MEGIEYLVALSHFNHFGPRRLRFLFNHFGSWQKAWEANSQEFINSGLKTSTADLFTEHRKKPILKN